MENEWFYETRNKLYHRNVTNFNKISEDKAGVQNTIDEMDEALNNVLKKLPLIEKWSN